MNEPDLEVLFRGLPEVEPSAPFLRRLRTIPLEHGAQGRGSWIAWPLWRTASALGVALAVGLVVGSLDFDMSGDEVELLTTLDTESVIDIYSELE